MYKHLLQDPTFFRVVEKADEVYAALGQQPISKYLKGEDIRTLSTPALFTVQVALFEMLRETGFEPDYLTGFSFGEYAALSCAGVISFKDALALIHYRELHSPPAGELGKLLAVTASPEKIATILRETAFSIAGKNSPRQTLIATAHPDQVQKMLQGVRTLVVDVDQPYHSDLLLEVRGTLKKELAAYQLKTQPPTIPVVSSVHQTLLTRENYTDKKVQDILIDQLTTPFDFTSQVGKLAECKFFVEIGPKKHVSGFLKDIMPAGNVRCTEDFFPPRTQHKATQHPVTDTIRELTGHKRITKEMRLQEDLGIDSLRKADILLRHLPKGSSFNPAEIRTVQDVITLVSTPQPTLATSQKTFARYTACWRPLPLLWPTKESATTCDVRELPSKESENLVVTCASLPTTFEEHLTLITQLQQTTLPANTVLHVLKETKEANALAALLKSLAKEQHTSFTFVIGGTSEQAARECDSPHTDVKYFDGKRWTLQWERAPITGTPHPQVLVAIGGATGITKSITRSFSSRTHIIGKKARQLNKEEYPLAESLHYHQADVTQEKELARALEDIRATEGHVDLILNGAGLEHSRVLREKSAEEIHQELGTKYLTEKNLSTLAPDTRVIHFSSVVAQFGNPGQTVYAYANALLSPDVVMWPPWEGIGMTAQPGVMESLRSQGVGLLSEASAITLTHDGVLPKTFLFANDEQMYQAGLLPAAVKELLGTPSPEGFTQELDLGIQPHLRDHTIQGKTYFPLAETITRFLVHAQLLGKTSLQDVHATRPIILPTSLTIRRSGEGLQAATTQTCVSAHMAEQRIPPLPPKKESIRKVEKLYTKETLFHGPHYQMLQDVHQTKEGMTAKVALTDASLFSRLTQYLDGMFQLLATHAHLSGERLALPVSVSHIQLNKPMPPNASIILHASSALTGDAWVVDDKEVILWCSNIKLKAA
jgi:[acyl-carrier-protein] S-malonyltransferase